MAHHRAGACRCSRAQTTVVPAMTTEVPVSADEEPGEEDHRDDVNDTCDDAHPGRDLVGPAGLVARFGDRAAGSVRDSHISVMALLSRVFGWQWLVVVSHHHQPLSDLQCAASDRSSRANGPHLSDMIVIWR